MSWCYLSPLPALENVSKDLRKKRVLLKFLFKNYTINICLFTCSKYLLIIVLSHKLKICKSFFYSTAATYLAFCLLLQVEKLQCNYSFFWHQLAFTCASAEWQYFSLCQKVTVLFEWEGSVMRMDSLGKKTKHMASWSVFEREQSYFSSFYALSICRFVTKEYVIYYL